MTGFSLDTRSAKNSQRGSSLGSVFLLSSHWVRRFFIDPSAGFSFSTLVKFGRFFHRQYQQSSSPQSGNKNNQQKVLQSALSEVTKKKRQGKGDKEEVTRRNPSLCNSRARSRRIAGDLSSWHGERRGACMVVDH